MTESNFDSIKPVDMPDHSCKMGAMNDSNVIPMFGTVRTETEGTVVTVTAGRPVCKNTMHFAANARVSVLNGTVVPASRTGLSEGAALDAVEEAQRDPTATYIAMYVDDKKVASFNRRMSRKGIEQDWTRLP